MTCEDKNEKWTINFSVYESPKSDNDYHDLY